MVDAVPQSPRAGSFILNDWLGQQTNLATIQGLSTTLVPVQTVREFQRRIRSVGNVTIPVTIGQFVTFSAVVPEDETWQIQFVGVNHVDAPANDHNITLRIIPGVPADQPYVVARVEVDSGQDTPLYPSHVLTTAASDVRFVARGAQILEAFPGDTVQIFDETALIAATGTFRPVIRYEVGPPPFLNERDRVFVGATF